MYQKKPEHCSANLLLWKLIQQFLRHGLTRPNGKQRTRFSNQTWYWWLENEPSEWHSGQPYHEWSLTCMKTWRIMYSYELQSLWLISMVMFALYVDNMGFIKIYMWRYIWNCLEVNSLYVVLLIILVILERVVVYTFILYSQYENLTDFSSWCIQKVWGSLFEIWN